MKTVLKVIERIDYVEALLERWFVLVVGAFVILLILSQVIFRYALHISMGWYQEILKFAYVWVILIGISYTWRKGQHIHFGALVNKVKHQRIKSIILILSPVLMLLFSIFLMWYGIETVVLRYEMQFETNYLQIPLFIEAMIFPLFGFLLLCSSVLQVIEASSAAHKIFKLNTTAVPK
jgi:TRAP-type C4-dicarboxylate transport system permease small subunit